MRVLGIDEAGRGCVLGPLLIGGFLTEATDEALRAAGAGDSKALSPARREAALSRLAALGTPQVRAISARDIDAGNLNDLEERAIVDLILHTRPERVLIDALGHPATLPATAARIEAAVADAGARVEVSLRPKADVHWPAVGAASIVAKVHRDAALDALRDGHAPFGSGYPSDPVTRRWLSQLAAVGAPWPPFVRTRWGTVTALRPGVAP